VHAALEWRALIDALREAFRAGAHTPLRWNLPVGDQGDRLLLMPAWSAQALGVKVVTVFPRNSMRGVSSVAALYLLLDAASGHPLALIDGEALTLRRTAAASALASTYLSRADSRVLAVIGTGQLAPYMALAHCAVRPIERVLVWGRTPERTESLAARLRTEGLSAAAHRDLAAAIGQADIITCATTARDPLVRGALVQAGAHVDLVGAFTPEMRESDDGLVQRAALFVDTRAGALKEAGDVVQPMNAGVIAPDHVRGELADLVTGRHAGRTARAEITLFKSVGTALEDLCAGRLVFERARTAAG
jgi:ornithine cyclodeaminase/alanine dehydrogenase-like protein (mu-crystallin family)